MHLYLLAKFTKCFKQVQQVKVLNKGHEDLCWPLIDTYKLAVYRQYLYLVIYRSHRRKKLSHFLGVILRPGWNHPYVYVSSARFIWQEYDCSANFTHQALNQTLNIIFPIPHCLFCRCRKDASLLPSPPALLSLFVCGLQETSPPGSHQEATHYQNYETAQSWWRR